MLRRSIHGTWIQSATMTSADHRSCLVDSLSFAMTSCWFLSSVAQMSPYDPLLSRFVPSITKEWQRNKGSKSRTTISDQLSSSLNELQNELEVSDLYENIQSRKHVLARAIPRTLVDKIGLDTLMKRLPEQVRGYHIWLNTMLMIRVVFTSGLVSLGQLELHLRVLDDRFERRFFPLLLEVIVVAAFGGIGAGF